MAGHGLEVRVQGSEGRELAELPAAEGSEAVNCFDPAGLGCLLLDFCVFAAVALDLDQQMQGVVFAVIVVDEYDEVWPVPSRR